MDFLKLKDSLFASSATNIEKVEVNQRHLIDKILARYSAEFTVYRELIQNANDAGATEVHVEFKTRPENKSSQDKQVITSIVVRNNGRAFSEDDWRRLKKIAEGNPDEQKIGFFGVGFYSLFSICEEPLVISGSKCLGFYWNGDQLYTKSADYSGDSSNWTNICLDLREPMELPDFDEFGQFLCKSLLFTYSLGSASFVVNDKVQLKCTKVLSPPAGVSFSKFKTNSGLFNLSSFEGRFVQMSIEKKYQSKEPNMDTGSAVSVFSGLWKLAQSKFTEKGKEEAVIDSKLRQPGTFHVFLKHFRASASVKTSSKFADEMERTTKKKPFQTVNIDLIYVNWEQINAANSDSLNGVEISTKHPILSQLLPCPSNGKVFIGFETHQTTGLGVHLTAPFIPTVERESIDFVDGCLKVWNLELVQLAGRLCRVIYEEEVKFIHFEEDSSSSSKSQYLKKSKHLMETFNFKSSTPSSRIGCVLLDEFLRYSNDIKLPSSTGFVSSGFLRHVPEEMLSFVRNTPRIPDEIATSCQEMLQKLAISRQSGSLALIHPISVTDIIEFELKPRKEFDEKQTVACLKWWIKQLANPFAHTSKGLSQKIIDDFYSALLVPSAQATDTFVPLNHISFYACDQLSGLFFSEKAKIKFFPIDCLSPEFSSKFDYSDLSLILRIQELNLADWLDCVVKWTYAKDLIEGDFELAEQLLVFLSKSFDSPPRSVDLELFQGRICNSLSSLKCIPVGNGVLKRPKDCYFEDVPRIQVSMNLLCVSTETRRSKIKENMLKGAGVLSHLPLDQIFANIDSLNWDHVGLIKYLVRVKDELSKSDMNKLKEAALFPDKNESGTFKLSQLYADNISSELIDLLKLKILKWTPSIPREGSEIGDFLLDLGFNYIISWRVLLKGVSGADPSCRAVIFRYFFENFSSYTDYNAEKVEFPFVPVESVDGCDRSVFLPSQVFLDSTLNHLGFYLLHPELKKYSQLLGIRERPATDVIVRQVIGVRMSVKMAGEVFSYCSRISNEFSVSDWRQFRQSSFIPCVEGSGNVVVYKSFDQVFLPSTSSPFADLFVQVDFGSQGNSFLRAVGVCDDPRCEDLIGLLLRDASGVFSGLRAGKYIDLLERISQQWVTLATKNPKLAKSFAASKSFIGHVRISSTDNDPDNEDDTKDNEIQYSLYGLNDVFLIDDVISQQIFNLPTVPAALESFYTKLGCRWVSTVIRSEWKRTGALQTDSPLVRQMRKILSERIGLIVGSLDSDTTDRPVITKASRKRTENVKFVEVDSIETCRTCRVTGESNSQPCCAFTDSAAAYATIYLSSNGGDVGQFDHFDLASVLVGLLCEKRGKLQDSLLVASLLTTPLSSLRAKGFQVNTGKMEGKIVLPNTENIQEEQEQEQEQKQEPEHYNEDNSVKKPSLLSPVPSLPPPQLELEKLTLNNPTPTPKQNKWRDSLMGILKKATSSGSRLDSPTEKTSTVNGDTTSTVNDTNTSNNTTTTTTTTSTTSTTTATNSRDEESLRRTLDHGIKSLKPHSSGDFDTIEGRAPQPPPITANPPNLDYCQVATSLKLAGRIGTCDFYFGSTIDAITDKDQFFRQNRDSLNRFYGLIVDDLAKTVFKISSNTKSIHFFFDPESSSIAFNRSRTLFFNFAYFQNTESSIRSRAFWFMTFCHELAHNFIQNHDAQHEFYMSSFAETYLLDFINTLQSNNQSV